jgi:hypothetical protein
MPSWSMFSPVVVPPGVIEAGTGLALNSPIDIGVPYYHTQDDFLALADSVLPAWYLDPLKMQSATDGSVFSGAGYELLQAFAKMFELASLAVGNMQVLATLAYSSGGNSASASVQFYRTDLSTGAFTLKAGTIVKTSATNRGYQLLVDVAFSGSDYFKPALVLSLGQDQDYNVKGPVVTSDGTVLPGEIDTVTLPVMDPPFAEPNLFVRQVADATGGCPPVLDQLGADRGIPRVASESDANYKKRARALPDTVSPGALKRHLDAIFYPAGQHYDLIETWENRFNSCWNAPIGLPADPIFGHLVELAYNDSRTDRFIPRWMGEVDHRSALVLVVPTFPTFDDRGEAYNDPATSATTTRGTSVWNGPVVDSPTFLSGVWNGQDDAGENSRAMFLHSTYSLLRSIKGGGVQVDFVPTEAAEVLGGAPYP